MRRVLSVKVAVGRVLNVKVAVGVHESARLQTSRAPSARCNAWMKVEVEPNS